MCHAPAPRFDLTMDMTDVTESVVSIASVSSTSTRHEGRAPATCASRARVALGLRVADRRRARACPEFRGLFATR